MRQLGRQSGEPSVEEILASIKKVIARDNRIAAAREPALRDRLGDVLDLGEVAAQVLATEPAAPRIARVESGESRTADDDVDDSDDVEGGLLNDDTTQSMRDSLAALAILAQPGTPPQIVRSGETSLEGLVRDMLRPMLTDWLDRNLPAMVERMVAAEIARIARKQG